jgi:dihydropteroate synthase
MMLPMNHARGDPPVLLCGRHRVVLDRPRVMGVINVTPDSFSDGGRHASLASAFTHAQTLLEHGADILDIGGESTRPGGQPVAEADECERVLPLIEAIRAECDARGVPISIDSRKPGVMRAAIAAGAGMVNDVGALRAPGALEVVVGSPEPVAVCLMHMRGEPASMQRDAVYSDVVSEVATFLRDRVAACAAAGIGRERMVIDPGFGFGKTVDHNLALLRQLEQIVTIGVPVLVGISRKSTLGVLTGRAVDDRVAGSVAAALAAVARGAAIVRVHDVRETVDALKVWQAVMR